MCHPFARHGRFGSWPPVESCFTPAAAQALRGGRLAWLDDPCSRGRFAARTSWRCHPALGADLTLNISLDEVTAARVVHDHIQALGEVPRDEPANLLTPQVDSSLGTERPREKLAVTEVEYYSVFTHSMKEAIVVLSETLQNDSVPSPQSERSLVNDGLQSAGQGTVSRRESRMSRQGLIEL